MFINANYILYTSGIRYMCNLKCPNDKYSMDYIFISSYSAVWGHRYEMLFVIDTKCQLIL